MKERKKAVIRARCPQSLKTAVEEVARLQRIDPADVIRIACETYTLRARAALQPPAQAFSL